MRKGRKEEEKNRKEKKVKKENWLIMNDVMSGEVFSCCDQKMKLFQLLRRKKKH